MVIRIQTFRLFSIPVICCILLSLFQYNNQSLSSETYNHININRVLIIDPGHGGADGGAVGIDGTVESGINLDIAKRLY